MIRSDKITTAFFGSVGFRESTLPGIPALSSENKESKSGLFFQDGNFLVELNNIYDCQNDIDITDDNFNALLNNMQNAVILESIRKVSERQSDFIQSSNLYPYEKSFESLLETDGRAVGFQITPCQKNGYILEIPWIELSFDTAKTFNVYLFNSNLPKSPIQTKSVTTVAGESVIADLYWHITDDSSYKGGKFYLVYFEDDLDGAKAYEKNYELSSYQVSTRFYDVCPVTMTHISKDIDVTSVHEQSETYGLNIGVNVYNDYTELFIRNKSLFYDLIMHQMTEKVLNLMITSTRTNITERINQAKLALYGSTEHGIESSGAKIKRAVEDLKKMLFYQPIISKGTLR